MSIDCYLCAYNDTLLNPSRSVSYEAFLGLQWCIQTLILKILAFQDTDSAWRINVHEAIIWAFLDLYNNLHLDRLSSDSQVVQVDPEIRIE